MDRARIVLSSVLSLVLLAALAACSSSSPTGSLKIVMSGLPTGVSGTVHIAGPGGYTKTVTSTSTLSVPAGTYTVSGSPARGADAVVPLVYDATTSAPSVDVAANATVSTTVTYASRAGSGHLWVPMHSTFEAQSYANADLAASGSPAPDVTLGSSSAYGEGLAFDGAGNMWVADYNGYVFEYAVADLGASGSLAPAVTIDLSAYGSALYALAFAASGDLWVSAYDTSQILMFTPSQLAAGGVQSATVVLDSTGSGSIAGPGAIAFDASGALWVGNYDNDTVVKFAAADLAASGSPTPSVILSATSASIYQPNGLAFDASGNLWVSNGGGTVVRFDAGQLGTTASPAPAATIAASSLGGTPTGLAFDASGSLWVSDHTSGDLLAFKNPGALTGSVSPSADVTISSIGIVDYPLFAFDPPPANLPIRTP